MRARRHALELVRRGARWFVGTPLGLAVLLELVHADELVGRNLLELLAREFNAKLELRD